MKISSIKNWQDFGKNDPYFGVLSEEKFKLKHLTPEHMEDFFSSGEIFVQETSARIQRLFGRSLEDCSILDFGCGVGRLTIPFAKISKNRVKGIDVSTDIIERARAHKRLLSLDNLEFESFDGRHLEAEETFDIINSYIVFQHIEPSTGMFLLKQLLEKLKTGGLLQVQITYGHQLGWSRYLNFYLRTKFYPYNYVYSFFKNRKFGAEATMQMNHYDPKKLFKLFSEYSGKVHVEFTDHGGHLGAYYILRKDF